MCLSGGEAWRPMLRDLALGSREYLFIYPRILLLSSYIEPSVVGVRMLDLSLERSLWTFGKDLWYTTSVTYGK